MDYYLPAGRWTNFLSGEVVEGGRWLREQHDYLSLPLMVRPNSAIVVGDEEDRPDYEYDSAFTLCIYQLSDGGSATAAIPNANGSVAVAFSVLRSGHTITVQWEGEPKQWRALLAGIEHVGAVDGGEAESSDKGTLVTPFDDVDELTIEISCLE